MMRLGSIVGVMIAVGVIYLISEEIRVTFWRKCQIVSLMVILNSFLYYMIHQQSATEITVIKNCIFVSLLLLIGAVDYYTSYVYQGPVLMGYSIGILLLLFEWNSLINQCLGALLGFSIIHIIIKLTNGMGEGDRQIATLCGLFLGIQGSFITLFLAFIIGAFVSVVLMLLQKISGQDEIPFGPFIALGGILTLLYENQMVQLYLNLFS